MKKVFGFLLILLVFVNCGGNGNEIIEPEPPVEVKILALDDSFQTVEEQGIELLGFLSNDTYPSNLITLSMPTTSTENGTITERNNEYSYTPATGFSGTDSFTYTICNRNDEENCSTATITIEVTDEGSPIAVNDEYSTNKNVEITIDDFLNNDTIVDNAEVDSIDSTSTVGTVVLNPDGTITYTPQTDFTGDDTFTYTLCDDDATESCSTATITITVVAVETITFNIPTALADYYEGITFTTSQESNREALKELVTRTHTTELSYGQRHNFLYNADSDLSNAANVILMYTGESRDEREYTSGNNSHNPQTFNTEHIYPQSKLSSDEAVADLHHLRACDASINSERSNYPFVDGSGVYKEENNTWYPGDEWKGDVARMIFYLNVRHGETFNQVGSMDLFLKWNKEDPVSEFEKQRNNVIAAAQGNRNPFIDNPYLVTITWGGENADNTWE